MFRSVHSPTGIDTAHIEELRRQDARRAMERECRVLRREFRSLEKDHHSLKMEHEFHSQRLDSLVVQSGALLGMIGSLNMAAVEQQDADNVCKTTKGATSSAPYFDEQVHKIASLEAENKTLIDDRTILLRRNSTLELQVSTVMAQFGSLLTDHEDVCTKLKELRSAVASATSIEELNEWVQL